MVVASGNPLFDEILEFLDSTPTPEQIIAFKPSQLLDQRLHYLLDQNSHDRIMSEERNELDEFLRVDHFITMLKIRAHDKLAEKS